MKKDGTLNFQCRVCTLIIQKKLLLQVELGAICCIIQPSRVWIANNSFSVERRRRRSINNTREREGKGCDSTCLNSIKTKAFSSLTLSCTGDIIGGCTWNWMQRCISMNVSDYNDASELSSHWKSCEREYQFNWHLAGFLEGIFR